MSTFNNNPKQTLWETWFISSISILLILLFIGTVIRDLNDNIHYIIILVVSFINALCAIIIGLIE